MKKTFVRPVMRRYDFQIKEPIMGSWRPEDGMAGYYFHFIQYAPGTTTTVSDKEGCYDILQNFYPTAGHMTSRDSFLNWYTGINITQHGQEGNEDHGHEGYGDFINLCEYKEP